MNTDNTLLTKSTALTKCVVEFGIANLFRNSVHFFKIAFVIWAIAGTSAQAWWNSDWPIRKKITIDTSDKGVMIGEPIGTTVVLVRLFDGNFQFTSAKDDGSDIRFVAADDKTPLTYHIEKYDSLMSEAFVWVKVPDIKPGAQTTFWLYYGNTGGKVEKVEDAKGTYDLDSVLVYHFTEKNAPARDYSSANNNAQTAGVTVDGSMIGAGLRFDGKNTVQLPDAASLAWPEGGSWTLTAWVKLAALQSNASIYSHKDGAKGLVIGADNGVPYIEINGQRSAAGAPFTVNTWHYFAVVSNGTKVTLYIDGEVYGAVSASLPTLSTAAMMGGFNGELDELQISKTARSGGVIKFAAVEQGGEKGSKIVSFGDDEQTHSWFEGGTFGVIIKSLTVDGWVVIGILMVMSLVSWIVMFTKVSYLNSIGRGNELFMKEWRHLAADLTVLDHGDPEQVKTLGGRVGKDVQRSIRQSSLYRIFHIGSDEIRHRLASGAVGENKVLSAQSIEAIRACLHTGLVREGQKLSNLMVVLTISISGGPFLGLLGTVVGVMITFAAIAQAGDVNVNAIAPGIAAALLATIAGLAVAIPALFGYNYILLRVKDANSDMAVFVDEFVARMAEFYSGEIDHTLAKENDYASPGR